MQKEEREHLLEYHANTGFFAVVSLIRSAEVRGV